MKNHYYVYIVANQADTMLEVGVATNLPRRIWEHKEKLIKGDIEKYAIDKLVYYEHHEELEEATRRAEQLKSESGEKLVALIEKRNILWNDLYEEIF